jgi:hypothetical protein
MAGIDGALDRLMAALEAVGDPMPAPAAPRTAIDAIAREIAPMSLPADLIRLWSWIAVDAVKPWPFPRLCGPAFALESWREQHDLDAENGILTVPRMLFPVAYESWSFLLVELDSSEGPGGAIFQWGFGGTPFQRRFDSVSDWIETLAAFLSGSPPLRHEADGRAWTTADDEAWDRAVAEYMSTRPPHPRYGAAVELDEDFRRWPGRWLRSSGFERADASVDRALAARRWERTWTGVIRMTRRPRPDGGADVEATASRSVDAPHELRLLDGEGHVLAVAQAGSRTLRVALPAGASGLVVAVICARDTPSGQQAPVGFRTSAGLLLRDGEAVCDHVEHIDLHWLGSLAAQRPEELREALASHVARGEYDPRPTPDLDALWARTLAETGAAGDALREVVFAAPAGASLLAGLLLRFAPRPEPPSPPAPDQNPVLPEPQRVMDEVLRWPRRIIGCPDGPDDADLLSARIRLQM